MGENFNDNLKEARIKAGLTQKTVSENIGVAKSTYSLYESGGREPSVNTIKKIADILNVSADTLLGIENDATTIAAHLNTGDLTDIEREDVQNYIEFIKTKRNK